jgi:hypothetical protein
MQHLVMIISGKPLLEIRQNGKYTDLHVPYTAEVAQERIICHVEKVWSML